MKRTFGSWLTRFLRGGHRLTDGEHHLLSLLVMELPPHLRGKIESQFESYNLVQREIDKRALNFYRVRAWRSGVLPVTPTLKCKVAVAPLVKIKVTVASQVEPLHAVLTAVNGHVFSVSFDRPVPRMSKPADYQIEKVTQAWRSNFHAEATAA